MAVVNTLTGNLTNLDASPTVLTAPGIFFGKVRSQFGTVETAAADDDTSTYRLGRLYSTWRVVSIRTFNDAVTSGTSFDIGLYQTAANGGAVLDVDAYASAVDLSSASTVGVEHAFEARNITAIGRYVYEDGQLTTDTKRFYDLVYTANTVGSAAATISCLILSATD